MSFLDDDPTESAEDKMSDAMGCFTVGGILFVVGAIAAIVALIRWLA